MVDGAALESLQPAGRFVRRDWRDGGIFPGYKSGYYPLILHRNLAFFRKVCKAVLEKLNMEMYSRGRKREHSKCFRSRERRVGSTPTISARRTSCQTWQDVLFYFPVALPPVFRQLLWQRQRLFHRGGAELLGLGIQVGVDVGRGGNVAVAQLFLNLLPMKRKNAGHGSGSIPGYSIPSLLGIRNSRPMVCCFGSPRRITMDSDSVFRALPYKKRIEQDRT